jgi:RNA polymerase-binding transcription factor DksA
MTSEQREQYRQRLLSMAARLKNTDAAVGSEALRQIGGDASGNLSNVPLHLADVSTEAFEQEMSTSLLQNERQFQAEVAAALDRFEQGTFGRCEGCGQSISEGRLQAVPYTRYCLACAQQAEDDGEVGFQPTLL